ncbi:uncharacterized protein LOC127278634 [Leptopilina boulardi]|uniref:uncharacterized protein LOC127278634 n=1 Tax=Leptopilina boulardi TaxID=63433 RepID=UPI0021F533AB|nr:uncharacterized protein LOC127278634 [Leptopilina boulardi]
MRLKKAIINIQNNDSFCFLWSIVAALHPAKYNVSLTDSYPHYSQVLKYDDIEFPIRFEDIEKFEKLNKLSINIYGEEQDKNEKRDIVPLYLSREKSELPVIHLFAVEIYDFNDNDQNFIHEEIDRSKQKLTYHFTLVKNLSRLISSQVSRNEHRILICDRCLCHFTLEKSFERHRLSCEKVNKCRVILPDKNNKILSFKNYRFKERVPFVVYADIECLLEPADDSHTNTSAYQKHVPTSVAYYLHCSFDESLSKFNLYRGKNCIEWFLNELKCLSYDVNDLINNIVPMEPLTKQQNQEFQLSTICHICEKIFTANDIKHRDHCHFTGKFRGAAHRNCNVNYKDSYVIPVVFHNLSGYDCHFFIRALATNFEGQINLLPVNKEKYIAFTKKVAETKINLRFVDSFRFMSSSLEKLASYLSNDKKEITRKFSKSNEEFNLLTRKGVFPYEYIDSWSRLDEESLPPKEAFFSKLYDEHISEQDYFHA